MTTPDPDSNEARLARHRALHSVVHPDVAAASRESDRKWMQSVTMAAIQRDTAIRHLHALLNSRRTATQSWEAEQEARLWLESIGSEAP